MEPIDDRLKGCLSAIDALAMLINLESKNDTNLMSIRITQFKEEYREYIDERDYQFTHEYFPMGDNI